MSFGASSIDASAMPCHDHHGRKFGRNASSGVGPLSPPPCPHARHVPHLRAVTIPIREADAGAQWGFLACRRPFAVRTLVRLAHGYGTASVTAPVRPVRYGQVPGPRAANALQSSCTWLSRYSVFSYAAGQRPDEGSSVQ